MTSSFDRLMEIANGDYGDIHKLLAQTLLNESVFLNLKISDFFLELVKLFHREFQFIHLNDTEKGRLQTALLQKMNEKLSEVFFHIVRGVDEYGDSKPFYTMVSDMPYNEAFAASVGGYTKQQMGLFDMWLQIMYVTNERKDGRISYDQALNAIDLLKYTLPKKSIQDMVNKMVEEKWLINANGMLRLHPRALAELRQTLIQAPFSLQVCSCSNAISNRPAAVTCKCGHSLHAHCYSTLKEASVGAEVVCANCQEPLTHSGDNSLAS